MSISCTAKCILGLEKCMSCQTKCNAMSCLVKPSVMSCRPQCSACQTYSFMKLAENPAFCTEPSDTNLIQRLKSLKRFEKWRRLNGKDKRESLGG